MKRLTVIGIVLLLAILAGCEKKQSALEEIQPWLDAQRSIVVEVTGTTTVIFSVTVGLNEDIQQWTNLVPPFRLSKGMMVGDIVSVTAQNGGDADSSISAKIYVDDSIVKSVTSTGTAVIASTSTVIQ